MGCLPTYRKKESTSRRGNLSQHRETITFLTNMTALCCSMRLLAVILGEGVYFHLHTIQFFMPFPFPSNSVEVFFFKQLVFPYPQAQVPEQITSEKQFFSVSLGHLIDYRIAKLYN